MVIAQHGAVRSLLNRYFGPYHCRLPLPQFRLSNALIGYIDNCRDRSNANIFVNRVIQGISEFDGDPADVDTMAAKIARRFPQGNISIAFDPIAGQSAIGRFCIGILESPAGADLRRYYAPLLRRVFVSGLGLHMKSTDEELAQTSKELIQWEDFRHSDPAILETWTMENRRRLAGVIAGDLMAEDFLDQWRKGVRKPKPTAEIVTFFSTYIMFDSADASNKATARALKIRPPGPGTTPAPSQ